MLRILILISGSFFVLTQNYAQEYHSLGGGDWSYEKDGASCGCQPILGADSVFVYHTLPSSANSRTWGPGSYLYVGDGGLIDIDGNNAERIIQSLIEIDAGGTVEAKNGLIVNIDTNGSLIVHAGGNVTFNNNLDFTNNGTFIINGTITGSNNSDIFFGGTSAVEINGEISLGSGTTIENNTSLTGSGKLSFESGSYSGTGDLNGCTTCSTSSPIYLSAKAPSGDISNITIYDNGAWTNGTPTSTLHATVLDTISTSSSLTAQSLTTGSLSRLTITSGNSFTVVDSISNAGLITVQNNASLIQNAGGTPNDENGRYRVIKTGASDTLRYNMWSAPLSGQRITSVYVNANLYDAHTFEASTQSWKYDFGSLNPENQSGTFNFQSGDLISGADGIMNTTRGYFIPGNGSGTNREFIGSETHNGNYTANVVTTSVSTPSSWNGNDWNLLGNPYPSNLSIDDFLNHNSAIISNAVYLWDNTLSVIHDFQ